MNTSFYQGLKLNIINILELPKDSIHMHVGLAVFFLAVVLWKKGRVELVCLIPVILTACLMEALDLRDNFNSLGHMNWSASVHDLINTVFWPVIIAGFVKFKKNGKLH